MSFGKKIARPDFVPVEVSSRSELQAFCEPGKKILIVDDDLVNIESISSALHSGGYETIFATDGAEAICRIRDESPDLMLVHVCLPPAANGGGVGAWNGFQVIQWGLQAGIPAIVISGVDGAEYGIWTAAVGAECFVAKPLDAGLLLGAVESVLADPMHKSCEMGLKMAV